MMRRSLTRLMPALLAAAVALTVLPADAATPLAGAAHRALDAAGPQSGHIVDLWRIFMFTCTAVFAAIVVALLYVLWRRPRAGDETPPDLSMVNRPEPGPRRHVTNAVVVSILGLLVLIVASVFTDRALARMPLTGAINIEVTAHQWWWTVRYMNGGVSDIFETANEIHVPVGQPIVVKLNADDVIHSLWVPNLAGKKDLIPGRTSVMRFRADQAGVYRGQCAEFCGYQHALMGLFVMAEPQQQFEAWRQAQRAAASQPQEPKAQRGKEVFESGACALCHSVQGTRAQGHHAPDLTHLASRQTIAAGALPNTPQALGGWIVNPQLYKPGTNMPAVPMSSQDLDAVVAYLGSLK